MQEIVLSYFSSTSCKAMNKLTHLDLIIQMTPILDRNPFLTSNCSLFTVEYQPFWAMQLFCLNKVSQSPLCKHNTLSESNHLIFILSVCKLKKLNCEIFLLLRLTPKSQFVPQNLLCTSVKSFQSFWNMSRYALKQHWANSIFIFIKYFKEQFCCSKIVACLCEEVYKFFIFTSRGMQPIMFCQIENQVCCQF